MDMACNRKMHIKIQSVHMCWNWFFPLSDMQIVMTMSTIWCTLICILKWITSIKCHVENQYWQVEKWWWKGKKITFNVQNSDVPNKSLTLHNVWNLTLLLSSNPGICIVLWGWWHLRPRLGDNLRCSAFLCQYEIQGIKICELE